VSSISDQNYASSSSESTQKSGSDVDHRERVFKAVFPILAERAREYEKVKVFRPS
jgi:hypothetical protein